MDTSGSGRTFFELQARKQRMRKSERGSESESDRRCLGERRVGQVR